MKQLIVVVLTLILLAGCHRRPPVAVENLPLPPPPARLPAAPQPIVRENPMGALLRRSTSVLRDLTLESQDAVPDALLNRTRCFIFVLPGTGQGLGSCRSAAAPDQWSTPELFSGFQPAASGSLIFVLSARAADALAGGNLDLSQFTTAPGETQRQKPLLTAQDLAYAAVTFAYAPPLLSGAAVPINSITRSRPATLQSVSATAGEAAELVRPVPPALTAAYLDWVTSYFNAITPTGIIIHHTAAIPLTGRVPSGISDVDRYHADRGLDIECMGREYHVAYHYLILPNGNITPGRPERCEGAHARAYNSYIGISLVGDFSTRDNPGGKKGLMRPTRRQLKSLVRLTRRLQQQYSIPVQRILRHSDVAPTLCPGDRFAFKSFLVTLEQSQAQSR